MDLSDAAVPEGFFWAAGPPPRDLRKRDVMSGARRDALTHALDVDLGSCRANEHHLDVVPVRGCCAYDPGPRTSRIGTFETCVTPAKAMAFATRLEPGSERRT